VAYNPNTAIPIKLEAKLGGVWTTITSRGRAATKVQIKVGRSDRANLAETAMLDCELGNDDGYLTEDHPLSPWYGLWGRNTQVRVSLTGILGGGDAQRFTGRVEVIEPVYPGGDTSSVRVRATGTLGQVGQDDEPLGSPLSRSQSGFNPSGVKPLLLWPMEDESGATSFASGLPGGAPLIPVGAVTFAGTTGPAGTKSIAKFAAGTSAPFDFAYADTGEWTVQLLVQPESVPGSDAVFFEAFPSAGGGMSRVAFVYTTGGLLEIRVYDPAGAPLFTPSSSQALPAGAARLISTTCYPSGGTMSFHTLVGIGDRFGEDLFSGPVGTVTPLRRIRPVSNGQQFSFGGLAVYTNALFTPATDGRYSMSAAAGWVHETTTSRATRLGTEVGLTVEIPVASTYTMGAQLADTLSANLADVENTDLGILSDTGADGALRLRTLADLYNQTVALAITTDAVSAAGFAPVWDNSQIRNQWTVTRPGGSTAVARNDAHIAKTGVVRKDATNASVETDAMLQQNANWRVNTTTAPGPRVPSIAFNLRNQAAAAYAAAIVALKLGDRITVAESVLPDTFPPGGLDVMVIGWQEILDADTWWWVPNVSPYRPYEVFTLDDTRLGRLLMDDTFVLNAGVTATATSLSVAFTGRASTTTSVPFDIDIDGERMTVTAVAGATSPQTFTVTRAVNGIAKAHLINAAVNNWRPGVLGL
jgi:hypothetical protein